MSVALRQTEPDLKASIESEAYRFDFFQLVYLLEHWVRCAAEPDDRPQPGASKPEPTSPQLPIGRRGPLPAEGLRLRPDPRLTFSPADVRRVEEPWERTSDGERVFPQGVYRLIVNFMGLYGVAAPSPVYLSELINAPEVDTEPLSEFLDLFNHRLLSLYYRAWQKYRYPYRYSPGAKDEFSSYVLAFTGLREPEVRRMVRLPVARLIKYLGLLGPRTRPLMNLRLLIADYFRLPEVRIKPWILRWVEIPPAERNRIGERNCELGENFSVGEEAPDRSGRFRVRIGPFPYATYLRFLPDSESFRQLCALVHLWVADRFDYDVELVIDREEIPEAELAADGVQLGWTGWVTSQPGLAEDPSIIFPKRAPEAL